MKKKLNINAKEFQVWDNPLLVEKPKIKINDETRQQYVVTKSQNQNLEVKDFIP